MNQRMVKEKLYDATALFFVGATVIWAEQIITKPSLPYVTLKLGGINRSAFPVEDGEGRRLYYCSTLAEVNLYTNGEPITEGEGHTGNCINTAMADLMEFSNFLESEAMVNFFSAVGIDVYLMPPVRDLTSLQNDSKYRYRAMVEYAITFVMEAGGYYGLAGMCPAPNSSGGGTEEMVKEPIGTIDEAEVKEEEEKKKDEE